MSSHPYHEQVDIMNTGKAPGTDGGTPGVYPYLFSRD